MNTAAAKAPYATGQAVEVHVYDFKAPGMPRVWVPAHVTAVCAVDGTKLWDVTVQYGDLVQLWRVGPRRGNALLRPAQEG